MDKSKNLFDDGFHAELVADAIFSGILQIPTLKPPKDIIIPKTLIPFSKRKQSKKHDEFVCFYEYDIKFRDLLTSVEQFLPELKAFPGIITPDCSLYRDMPLVLQLANIYMNRAIGYKLQSEGIYVIPSIRWGDDRTYTDRYLPEQAAFLGVPKNSIVSVSTYGCMKDISDRVCFQGGLDAMLDALRPHTVLVYGPMPEDIFEPYDEDVRFVQYDDWITFKHRKDLKPDEGSGHVPSYTKLIIPKKRRRNVAKENSD